MADQYYIRLAGKSQGPFDGARLQEMAKRGLFGRSHEVSTDGRSWSRAAQFPELFPTPNDRRPLPPKGMDLSVRPPDPTAQTANMQTAKLMQDVQPLTQNFPASGGTLTTQDTGPAADATWLYTSGPAELGPVSLEELKRLAAIGQITANDYVWTEGMDQWCEASQVLGPYIGMTSGSKGQLASTHHVSGMAVASFVFGLLGTSLLFCFGSLLAVVFGHVALAQIRKNSGSMGGKGMAIAGLVLGYLVLITTVIVLAVVLAVSAIGAAAAVPK